MIKIYTGAVLTAIVGASVAGLMLSAAKASPMLISVGDSLNGTTITTVGSSQTGMLNAGGSLGNFSFTASAFGAPKLPQPDLLTQTLNVDSSGGGTFYLFITEQNLTSPTGVNSFLSTFALNSFLGAVSSVTEETYVSSSNLKYSGTLLSSATFIPGGLATWAGSALSPALGPLFSETIEYMITTTGFGSTNDTAQLAVPEPATFGIFGASLGLMALIARRRRAF